MKLKVNEIFKTFQGEGASIGLPVTFLRLSVCNLHCVWCDTWYTWNFGKGDGIEKRFGAPTVKMEDELHEMETLAVAEKLIELQTRNIVISGGEPMLQQKALIELFSYVAEQVDHIEIETNGTIPLVADLMKYVKQINCSPKLENSGNSKAARYRPEVLMSYEITGVAWFKFVVTSDADLIEIEAIVQECGLTNVILMPQGKTKIEQEAHQQRVAAFAEARGWRFSPRLHILLYDNLRGV